MLFFHAVSRPKDLDKTLQASGLVETVLDPVRIARHGPMFIVYYKEEILYVENGSRGCDRFAFPDGSRVTEHFTSGLQTPEKTFELIQRSFAASNVAEPGTVPTPIFTLFDVTSDGKKAGCFFCCSSAKGEKLLRSLVKSELTKVNEDETDMFRKMIKGLFTDIPASVSKMSIHGT